MGFGERCKLSQWGSVFILGSKVATEGNRQFICWVIYFHAAISVSPRRQAAGERRSPS